MEQDQQALVDNAAEEILWWQKRGYSLSKEDASSLLDLALDIVLGPEIKDSHCSGMYMCRVCHIPVTTRTAILDDHVGHKLENVSLEDHQFWACAHRIFSFLDNAPKELEELQRENKKLKEQLAKKTG